jgi:hypothetical protein
VRGNEQVEAFTGTRLVFVLRSCSVFFLFIHVHAVFWLIYRVWLSLCSPSHSDTPWNTLVTVNFDDVLAEM